MARRKARRDEWMRDGEKDGVRAGSLEGPERSGGGRTARDPWANGNDAATMKPRLMPDYELLPRDDSGGPEWDPYTAQFGDGGYVQGEKPHLSVRSSEPDDPVLEDEVSDEPRTRAAKRAEGERSVNRTDIPAKSRREAREE